MKHVREPGGRHRAQRGSSRHRADARPRYGGAALAGLAATVAAVSLVAGLDLLPAGTAERATAAAGGAPRETGGPAATDDRVDVTRPDDTAADDTPADDTRADRGPAEEPQRRAVRGDDRAAEAAGVRPAVDDATALPPASGTGRRVVFSESEQRVWLVGDTGEVLRTHLASGSVYDNLDPGTYEVFSRSRHAVGIDDSGTMEYFVRFTHGDAGAAIGFHTIPVDDGVPVQTLDQLGTPLSHGCIRQKRSDAVALWDFAPLGTTVVVVP